MRKVITLRKESIIDVFGFDVRGSCLMPLDVLTRNFFGLLLFILLVGLDRLSSYYFIYKNKRFFYP